MIFDAMGMACADLGDFLSLAQACAKKALDLAAAQLACLQARLQCYQHHEPWRESFRATNDPVKN